MGGVSRRLHLGRLAVAGMAALGLGVIAEACADGGYAPLWKLDKIAYDSGGSSAMLTPGNDTRVNLLLLLADRRGTVVRDPAAKQEGPPLVLFPWAVMAAGANSAATTAETSARIASTKCYLRDDAGAEFLSALEKSKGLLAIEKERLINGRAALRPGCEPVKPLTDAATFSSSAGRSFATYLSGAERFYADDFADAKNQFATLALASDPWVREAALYMVARSALNVAQSSAFDEYGSLKDVAKRDQPTIAAAGTAFDAYLRAYPRGHYAASARGLQRRVAWLGGNQDRVAAAYDEQVARTGAFDGSDGPFELAQEIDLKLLSVGGAEAVRDPMLLATVDLQRMRCDDEARQSCTKQIGQDELERQALLFARDKPLFDYVRAAHALFVRRQPREVLALIPDASHQARFSTVQFSRQMLRGLALDAVRDRNARGFWLSLLPGAVAPYQRPAVELALATHDENSGHIEAVFAPGSQVTHPVMRELLLEHVAGPALLRQ